MNIASELNPKTEVGQRVHLARERFPVFARCAAALLLAGMVARADAEQTVYTYDPSGNPTASLPTTPAKPAILTQPTSQLLRSNEPVTLSVIASGVGLSYQWFSNGVALAGATDDSLLLANLPLIGTNAGNFSVIVSNSSGSVTSAPPAAIWPDANDNGVPDWWELAYYNNLNQSASSDSDSDGVSLLEEFLEGTNPTNNTSFDPRLFVEAHHGSVSISPLQHSYSMGQFVSLTATPDAGHQFIAWSGSVMGTKSPINVLMDTNKFVTATFGFPLSIALDNTNQVWTSTNSVPWFGQAEVSHDGIGAAQSGPIVAYWNGSEFVGQETTLQTVVESNQPVQVSFWWNVSSRPPDALNFAIDGIKQASISGEAVGWQFVQTTLAAGRHMLTWTYTKDPVDLPTGVPFADAGWVDEFSLSTANLQPSAPLLSIMMPTTNTVLIYWQTSSVAFSLQQNFGFDPAAWLPVTNAVNVVGGENQVLISPAAPRQFYRLAYP